MTHPIPVADFRALRWVLDPDEFALGPDEPEPQPPDMIDEHHWSEIMTLPSDVSIRTTNWDGNAIGSLHDLRSSWLELIEPPRVGEPIFDTVLPR
jgi:hypothetical protein